MTNSEEWPNAENFTRETSIDEKCATLMTLILKSSYEMRTKIVNGEAQTSAHSEVYESSDEREGAIRIRQLITFNNKVQVSRDAIDDSHDLGDVETQDYRVYSLEVGSLTHPDYGDEDIEDHDRFEWSGLVSVILEVKDENDPDITSSPVDVVLINPNTGIVLTFEEKMNLLPLLYSVLEEAGLNQVEFRPEVVGICPPVVETLPDVPDDIYRLFTHKDTNLPPQCAECSASDYICIHTKHILN